MEDKFIGKRLDGRYEIRELIGVGGMAMVYKAYDNTMDRIVAVKILKEEFASNEDFLRRFKNESKAVSMLSHPNIVKVFDVSIGDLLQYIVMEYIDGITLKEYIEQQGKLEWKDAVHFVVQILRGLQHAHDKGIVHRDVKPQNVMVLANGTIKVTDFGIARFARGGQRTITDKAIGSVHYISPEQARGDAAADKADIYSVGVMLYEMLTGQVPFQADSAVSVAIMQLQREPKPLHEIDEQIPLGLEQITMHAMQKDANRRYHSASEMLCNLEEFKKDPEMTFEYSTFVDNDPTKYVADVVESTEEQPQDEQEQPVAEKTPVIPILAGVAVTFVVALIILCLIFIPKLFGKTGTEVVIPDFAKYTLVSGEEGDANAVYEPLTYQELLDNADLNEKFKFAYEWEYNADYEYGEIYDTQPGANRKVKKGSEVTVYVSMGQVLAKVPDVYGKSETLAITELKAEGFNPIVVEMPDENVADGMIIRTEPERGTSVYSGTDVTIYVSTGEATKYVELPNVIGLYEAAAKKEIEDAGLRVGTVTKVNSSKPAGVVVSQNPSTNNTAQVGEGTTVNVEVSNGIVEYEFSVKVPIPDDYKATTGYVSAWINNGNEMYAESTKINLKNPTDYTFKFKTTESNLKVVIKLSDDKKNYDDYLELTVDCKKGSYSATKTFDYPKAVKEHTPSSSAISSNTSSLS